MTNPSSTRADEEIVGDALVHKEAFALLVHRYQERLARYLRRLGVLRREDTEDILQNVFLKTYRNLNEFDRRLKFSSWIYRITHNQVISQHRRLKARPEGYSVNIEDAAARNLAADIDIMAGADAHILQAKVNQILSQLDDKYREILVLKFLEEKNYQEISDIIKKPLGTVASMMNKAKQKFKQESVKQDWKL